MTDDIDEQVGGDHYIDFDPPPCQVIRSWNLPHAEGEAVYHIIRHASKHGRVDLEKARHWIDLIIALDYPTEPPAPT